MMEQNRNRVVLWATLLLITMLSLFSLHRSYQEKRTYLLEESQWMFQQAVHDDTGRRIEEMGDDYRFSFSGGAGLIKDTIKVQSEDTIIYIKNDIEAAKRASPKERKKISPSNLAYQ